MGIRLTTYLKKKISSIFYASDKSKMKNDREAKGCRILLYHSIGEKEPADVFKLRVCAEDFFDQMKYLYDNKYKVFGLSEAVGLLHENVFPEKSIVITFDDGYRDNLTIAAPILKKFNFPAIIFVSTEFLEPSENRGAYWKNWRFLSKEDLSQLFDFNIEVGLHGKTHQHLTSLSSQEVEEEIDKAKIELERYAQRQIKLFSYPHGAFNNNVIDILKRSGFIAACCSKMGRNYAATDFYQLRRTEITGDDSFFDFRKKLLGYYDKLNLSFFKK